MLSWEVLQHLIFGLVLLAPSVVVADNALQYCSTQNSGAGSSAHTSEFMSAGLCSDTCKSQSAAIAILQGNNCWCANSFPSSSTDLSNCQTSCPGFPQEKCASNGFFGYLQLGAASNSIGSSSSSTSSSSDSSSSSGSSSSSSNNNGGTSSSSGGSSSHNSPFSSPQSPSTSSTTSTSSTSTSKTSTSSSTSTKPTTTNSPIISATTVYETVSGSQTQIKTTEYVTETPSPTNSTSSSTDSSSSSSGSSSDSSSSGSSSASAGSSADAGAKNASSNKNSFFDSKGKVAGTFTAVGIIAVALIAAFIYFCCCTGCCGFGGRYANHSDEENGYSTDEASYTNDKGGVVIPMPPSPSTHLNLNNNNHPGGAAAAGAGAGAAAGGKSLTRDNSNKSVFSFFASNGASNSVGRNSSRKKLLTKDTSHTNTNAFNASLIGPLTNSNNDDSSNSHSASNSFGENDMMIPIAELDHRLEPRAVFLNANESKKSLGDENDYSRRILKITNPED